MTTAHAAANWFAGDDWQINATLLDENGNPFNLASATVKWCLMNAAYERVLDVADVTVVIVDAVAGQCSILVPAVKTSPLPGGKYTDAIRVIVAGITSTLSVGPILVVADPWAAAVPVAAAAGEPPRLRLAKSA